MTYDELRKKLDETNCSWRLKRLKREILKSGLPNRLINSLHDSCGAKLERNKKKLRTVRDWVCKWVWRIIVGLIVLILGTLILRGLSLS